MNGSMPTASTGYSQPCPTSPMALATHSLLPMRSNGRTDSGPSCWSTRIRRTATTFMSSLPTAPAPMLSSPVLSTSQSSGVPNIIGIRRNAASTHTCRRHTTMCRSFTREAKPIPTVQSCGNRFRPAATLNYPPPPLWSSAASYKRKARFTPLLFSCTPQNLLPASYRSQSGTSNAADNSRTNQLPLISAEFGPGRHTLTRAQEAGSNPGCSAKGKTIMNRRMGAIVAVLGVLGMAAVIATPAVAQTSEVKEKPPMYSYISNWDIPRAQWADMAKADEADRATLEKDLASGTIVGFGSDVNLIHSPDGETHDQGWSAMSMAGVIAVLEQFYKDGNSTSPVLSSATKHWDELFVSRYYNWHSGPIKNGYTHVGLYKLKPDASDDAVETISKTLVVPLLEKQLAAGTIAEYEIDMQAIHTNSPGSFLIVYVATNAEGLDKVSAAVEEALKANPLGGAAFGSMTDQSGHRDELVRTNATYK